MIDRSCSNGCSACNGAHKVGKAAIKAVRGDLPVGVSLAMFDDQAAGKNSVRDAMREKLYGGWIDLTKFARGSYRLRWLN